MKSSLYVGTVDHRRFLPREHKFRYSVLYYFLDLDEVRTIFKWPFIFSYNFPGLLSFWRKDYLGPKNESLKESVQKEVFEATGEGSPGPIRLMANISYFGFCFNPVAFYYCYETDGVTLRFIVSEITNTPWGERHRRVFRISGDARDVQEFKKDFHVSPFMPMSMDYQWIFGHPKETLSVYMQNRMNGMSALFFDSTLSLKRKSLTASNIMKYFFLFPLITFKTMVAIYYQAARLYLKQIPFHTHPAKEKSHEHSRAS